MNSYYGEYTAKRITPDDAVSLVKSGCHVVVGCGVAGPVQVQRQLHKAAAWAENVRILSDMAEYDYPFLTDPVCKGRFVIDFFFCTGPERKALALGMGSYLPAHLPRSAEYWMDNYPPDIFYGVATPMDAQGNFRLAPCLNVEKDAVERARTVVLEINPNQPVAFGDTVVNIRDVDYVIDSDEPMKPLPESKPDARSEQIGRYIAELVHDGDTLQLGIGGIPDAVAACLTDKHELGIHTEMITDSMASLTRAGVITNSRKTLHPGKLVGSFAYGSKDLYAFINGNPDVEFYRARELVDPRTMCQNDNVVSINTAFSCDLSGQVSSEAIGTRQYSGTGGQVATVLGALWSKNGRSIIAIRSTAETKNGVFSNIKAIHEAGTVVSLSRNDVDYIVTEYGIAHLRGKSVRDRANELIAVAHPDYRAELRRDYEKIYGV